MAYNILTGTVYAPKTFRPRRLVANIISGSFYGDGAHLENVPRLLNCIDNAIITNVHGDSNGMTCEPNMLFDGERLIVTGDITASSTISASVYYGDGSQLTGIYLSGENLFFEGTEYGLQFRTDTGILANAPTLRFQNNVLKAQCGIVHKRRTTAADLSLSLDDYYIGVDTASPSQSVTLTLPPAHLLSDGQTYVFKDEGGGANLYNISVVTQGSDIIDGQNIAVLEVPYAGISVYCNGTNKYFIY